MSECTRCKQLEEELAALRKQFKAYEKSTNFEAYFDRAPDGVFVVDETGRFLEVNPAGCTMLGYSEAEVLEMTIFEVSVAGGIHFNQLLENGAANGEVTHLKKDGSRIITDIHAVALDENRYVGFLRDITKSKQAEEALRKSEEQYRMIFDNSPLGIFHFDSKGAVTAFNDAFLGIIGASREETLGFNVFEEIKDELLRDAVKEAFSGRVGYYEGEYHSVRGKNIKALNATFAQTTFVDGKFSGGIGICEDVSEKKTLASQMERLDRLNLIGQMAAGLGHEVRNPMTTVRGFIQILASRGKYPEDQEYFDLMLGEIDRANSIITEYLSLAKDRVLNLQSQNLNQIINQIMPLLQANALLADRTIELELEQVPDLLLDNKEISQLVINLVRNGLEATPPGGRVSIRTFATGSSVVVSISDQGNGIPSEIIDKIGIPFFSTKETGTGLGLAICHSIAKRHGATVTLDTSSAGTTFFVTFKWRSDRI